VFENRRKTSWSSAATIRPLKPFLADQRGSFSVIFALTIIPILIATGMAIDYSTAGRNKSKLNAVADAAALAAVTPSMMSQSNAAATTAATNMFNSQAANVSGIAYSPANLSVLVTSTNGGLTRNVTVNYSAASKAYFTNFLGWQTIPFSGSSQASATAAPNIDFYLLLDSSPSMAIAATTSGINTMVSNTQQQGGCAFACHESNPQADNLGNPGGEDNYALARNLNVTLRMDLVQQAAANLMSTAQTTEQANNAAYRMSINTFDVSFHQIAPLTANLGMAKSQANNIQLLEVYSNNCLTQSNCNNDTDTNYDNAMNSINVMMPNPGKGTNQKGDSPQEVMMFVTDGVEDEMVNGSRQQSLMSTSWCTTIKNRGIRIAVLYTTYLPLPTNSWYNTYIAPFQPQIASNMQSCASPGLYFQVTTDGDISAAMGQLFQQAVATAHLTH